MSGSTTPESGRLIVELSQAGADSAALRSAAELARWFGLHLHGVFVEDEALLALAEFPFAREFRLPTHDWAPFAADRLAGELRHAADQARRLMQDVVAQLDVPTVFEVMRGDPVSCIAGLCSASDIVVVMHAATGAAAELSRLLAPTQGVAGSVLVLPNRAAMRSGPVVALLRDAADPVLDEAARIAAAREDGLVILVPQDAPEPKVIERAVAAGMPRQRITLRHLAETGAAGAQAALSGIRERLVITARAGSGVDDAIEAAQLATVRGTPVLLVELREARG